MASSNAGQAQASTATAETALLRFVATRSTGTCSVQSEVPFQNKVAVRNTQKIVAELGLILVNT